MANRIRPARSAFQISNDIPFCKPERVRSQLVEVCYEALTDATLQCRLYPIG
jgi:hypothetical protein